MRWNRIAGIAAFAATALLLVLPAVGIWASTYYVDFGSGSDTNPGTSTATPWRHSPGDANATGIPSGTTLHPGDTVVFKGGVQYTGTLSLTFSGSGGSPITYDGNSAGTFGAGQAIIDGNGVNGGVFTLNSVTYVTINYLEIRNATGVNGNGIIDRTGSTHITVSNCKIHDTGNSSIDAADPHGGGPGGETGGNISTSGGSYWTITGNLLYNSFNGCIALWPASYCTISNNEITDKTAWGVRITGGTGNSIFNNKFHDIYWYDWSTGYSIHTDFIFINPEGPAVTNTSIYNNFFYNNYTFTDNAGSAMINAECDGADVQNLYIYNNVFFNAHDYMTIEFGSNNGNLSGVVVYENSVWTTSTFCDIWPNGHTIGITIANNAITAYGALYQATLTGVTLVANNNCYNPVYGNFVSNTGQSFAQWKALGYDATSLNADPQFVSVGTKTAPAINAWNMQLQPSSPCISAGAALGSPFNMDIVGATRSAAWDVGAYQGVGSGTPPPSAPTGLRIQ
jgi:parallel beta-helix repeat protein